MSQAKKLDWPTTRGSVMSRLGRGDDETWREFVAVYAPILYRFFLRCGVPAQDVDDLVYHVCFKVRGFRYDPDRGRFRCWLMVVAYNKFRDWLREQGGRGGCDPDGWLNPPGPNIGSDWEDACLESAFREALATIRSELDRVESAILEATWIAAKPETNQAVADRLGIKPKAVSEIKQRILKRLKVEIERRFDDLGLRGSVTDPNPI